jgi:flagellar basal-body rod protein FlgG
MRVTEEGSVKALMPDNQEIELGQIQLATFVNEQGLLAEGNGLYRPTPASGAAVLGIPGENGLGGVAQGFLEGSNVNIANTMVDMINTQRAFELNSKALETASQMLGNIANIKP